MSAITCIAADLTVRQVATASPDCAAILQSFPSARDGQFWSLQELGPFLRQNQVNELQLLSNLSAAANLPLGASTSATATVRWLDSPLPLIFTGLAVGLSLGTAWGVALLVRIALGADYRAVPAQSVHMHGLAQLWGWLALFVFGVGSHLLRQNTKHPPPRRRDYAAGAAVVTGLILFFCSNSAGARLHLELVASSLLALGATCFAISACWSLVGQGQRPQLWHGFVLAMILWLLTWSCADIVIRARDARPAQPTDAQRALLIVLPVLGFATNAIYGFGIRLIPGLLNIASLKPRCFAAALVLHNAGLALFVAPPWRATGIAGSALMLLAAGSYLLGMNLLRSKPSRPIFGVDVRGHILIRAAFFWLVVALAMVLLQQLDARELPHAYSGAWRHALTVGFITTMILGVGHRVVPVFIRQPLFSTRWMLVSAAFILVGNAGRVALELATIGGWTWSFRLMGITGVLELAALILFAANLTATARSRRRTYRADEPITPATRVREAVNARPDIQRRVRELGVTMFDAVPFIAPSLTFGALALAWGMEPDELVESIDGRPVEWHVSQ